jgi:hypothetical protein
MSAIHPVLRRAVIIYFKSLTDGGVLSTIFQRTSDPVEDLHGSDDRLSKPFEDLQRPSLQQDPTMNDVLSGISHRLDDGSSERKAIHDRLVAIEHQTKRRGSRGFTRYLVAILIGVAATLAWQSYGEATKQIIATKAPELGWSPEAKQMIASGIQQLGWTKPPASPENTAPQQMVQSLAALRQSVQQLAAGQESLARLAQTVDRLAAGLDEVNREIGKLEVADEEILEKITPAPPPPRPIAAPVRKPTPVPPSSSSRAPIPLPLH